SARDSGVGVLPALTSALSTSSISVLLSAIAPGRRGRTARSSSAPVEVLLLPLLMRSISIPPLPCSIIRAFRLSSNPRWFLIRGRSASLDRNPIDGLFLQAFHFAQTLPLVGVDVGQDGLLDAPAQLCCGEGVQLGTLLAMLRDEALVAFVQLLGG